jgi:hypothetical protein
MHNELGYFLCSDQIPCSSRELPCESTPSSLGTYFANDGIYADAKYSSRLGSTWTDIVQNYESYGPTLLDLQLWDSGANSYVTPEWGTFNDNHVYTIYSQAPRDTLVFRIYDICPSNNSGRISVTVCKVN